MAFTANTMFELKVSNSVNDQLQNIPGYFGTVSGDTFTEADCDAGLICVQHALADMLGYNGIKNGNTWQMIAAASGSAAGHNGDHTGLYCLNNYEGNLVSNGQGAEWYLGIDTLGVGVLAGKRGTFAELIVGEQIKVGLGNFTGSTAPTDQQGYAVIANGRWTPASAAPTDGSVYAKILRTEQVTAGAYSAGVGYILQILRSTAA